MSLPLYALAEIAGCFAVWSWRRLWLIPGTAALAALTPCRRDSGLRQDCRHPLSNRESAV